MMKKNNFKITDEDMNCLYMLWRWKLLTTSALSLACYSTRSQYRAYCRLLRLEKMDVLKSTSSWDQKTVVWHLSDKGYEVIASRFENPIQGGFRSENKDHDFWVSAIHLGEWIKAIPAGCDLYSEQELRKLDPKYYPEWVPQTKQHRPDGWWKIGSSQSSRASLIALEVEFSKKTINSYNEIGDFYSNTINPYQVIWVVKSKGDINYILNHLKGGSSTEAKEQSFITLDQYIQHQWQSEVLIGKNSGKKLIEVLQTSVELGANYNSAQVLLDVRKKPIISMRPRLATKADLGLSKQY
jgi:hypothetical protein